MTRYKVNVIALGIGHGTTGKVYLFNEILTDADIPEDMAERFCSKGWLRMYY